MTAPSRAEMLYALRCFGAAIMALYLSMALDLPRPFWAVLTSFVVANPLAGAVRSKALYRLLGTCGGAAATVLLVPRFANAPELLSLALACWVGLCLYVSLLDRTPRSYVFMLAGYSAALIGFPGVADPAHMFDTALARVEEISIGIVCATLWHSLLLPQSLGPVLMDRVDRAIADAQRWMADVVDHPDGRGDGAEAQTAAARAALAGEISEIRIMGTHLPFDTSHLRWTTGLLQSLQDSLTAMLPLLLAVEDRLAALRAAGPGSLPAPWRALLADTARWVGDGRRADPAQGAALRAALAQLAPPLAPDSAWSDLLLINLAARLDALIEACAQCLRLRADIASVQQGAAAPAPRRDAPATPAVLHRDHGMALRSAFAAVIAIVACCAFWILSGWPSGATAPMMAAVFCSFFATQDNPVPAIKIFLNYTILSVPVSALYVLVAVPAVHSFETLALVLAPAFLPMAAYAGRPATSAQALAMLFGVAGTLSLLDTGSFNILALGNTTLAQLAGCGAAALFTSLLRTIDADTAVRRLRRAGRRELVGLAQSPVMPSLTVVSARMLDRIGLLAPRLALIGKAARARPAGGGQAAGSDVGAADALVDLRIGLNMAQLRQLAPSLSRDGIVLQPLMAGLVSHFRRPLEQPRRAAQSLLPCIDAMLRGVCAAADGQADAAPRLQAATSLASLRRDLFPAAPPYLPAPAESAPA